MVANKSKLVVYVAAERDQSGKHSPILDIVEQTENAILLHNQYDYANEKGREILAHFETSPPTSTHPWEQAMRQDFWGIAESDIVVLDLDSTTTVHFIAAAAVLNKTMLAVSSTLATVPQYFSGSVEAVVKPEELINQMGFLLHCKSLKKESVQARAEAEAELEAREDEDLKRSITDPNTTTKEKMQDILDHSVKKTMMRNFPVEPGH